MPKPRTKKPTPPAPAVVLRQRRTDPEPPPALPVAAPVPPPPVRNGPAACCQAYAAEIKRRRKEKHAAKIKRMAESRATKSCGRLPDGSAFSVTYDATAQAWSGSFVTTVNGQPARFEESAGAVFKLLAKLDRNYRAALVRSTVEGKPESDCVAHEADPEAA